MLLALAAVVWVVALFAAPGLPPVLGASLYALGSLICHQLPDRSFHLDGAQLPVCARCIGIYTGAAIAATLAGVSTGSVGRLLGALSARRVLLVGLSPTVLTIVLEWSGFWRGSNITRALAGLPLGAAAALVLANAAATLHYERCARRRPVESNPPPTHI